MPATGIEETGDAQEGQRACAEWIVKDRGGRSRCRQWRQRVTSGLGRESTAGKRAACRVGQPFRRFASIAAGGRCLWVMCGVWAMFNIARVFGFLTLLPRRRAPGLGSCFFCLASFGENRQQVNVGAVLVNKDRVSPISMRLEGGKLVNGRVVLPVSI